VQEKHVLKRRAMQQAQIQRDEHPAGEYHAGEKHTGDFPRHVSILVPTHNRARMVGEMLDSLARVRIPPRVRVDLTVVASACTDDTVESVRRRAGDFPFPCRCLDEPLPGAGRARNRALREATGEVIACLDDDVLVEPDWLEAMVQVFREHPADMVSGKIVLLWEQEPEPQWRSPVVENLLSSNDFGERVIPLTGQTGGNTANLAFRREVVQKLGLLREDLGRKGGEKLSGEDGEFAERAVAAGFRMVYAPQPVVRHRVPADRVNEDYLGRIAFGNGVSYVLMKPRLGPLRLARAVAGYTYLAVRHGLQARLARLRGDRRGAISSRLLMLIGRGGLVGLWRRFRR
jgi:GT2 family glycosyltransferase